MIITQYKHGIHYIHIFNDMFYNIPIINIPLIYKSSENFNIIKVYNRLNIRIETLFRYFNTTVAINTQYIVIVFVLKLPFPRALSTIRNIIALNG
jgi:hypothetical protein